MANKLKPILFLSYGEDLLQNKILQNQFIEFAKGFNTKKYEIHIHSAMPISRTRLFKNQEWSKSLVNLSDSLRDSHVQFSTSTLPALANWLYSNFWQFIFFHPITAYFKIWRYIKKHKIQYIYCRGYHAALAANILKRYLLPDLIIQFDPRGLFIEEAVYHKKFGKISKQVWLRFEKMIYENSDLVTFVSEPFAKQFNEIYKLKEFEVVYTHADISKFDKKDTPPPSLLTFCYLGQLDNSGWHQTRYLLDLFQEIHKFTPSKLLIITQSDHVDIHTQAKLRGLSGAIETKAAKNTNEVAVLLSKCHFALMCYKQSSTPEEELIAKTMVASKSGEYLAAGLPMICNITLRGIADLIERYSTGLTYELGNETSIPKQLPPLMKNYEEVSAKCREVAKNHFDLKKNIQTIETEIDRLCAQ